MYSFTDGFLSYHQIRITKEDQHKTTFVTEWGCFQYIVMPFGLKNAPVGFSWVIIASFKDFIQKFLQVYMDDWIVYSLIKYHLANLQLMLERFHEHLISLNYKKCIFCSPFGILLGHIVCKQGLLVDPAKIALILSFPPPTNVNMLRVMLGHMGYYRNLSEATQRSLPLWRNY